jgi:hypothetical protein
VLVLSGYNGSKGFVNIQIDCEWQRRLRRRGESTRPDDAGGATTDAERTSREGAIDGWTNEKRSVGFSAATRSIARAVRARDDAGEGGGQPELREADTTYK